MCTACQNGDILLYDGTTLSTEHSNGTVLVCYDNEYGTVCDDFWDVLDAMVVCTYLGFESYGMPIHIYHPHLYSIHVFNTLLNLCSNALLLGSTPVLIYDIPIEGCTIPKFGSVLKGIESGGPFLFRFNPSAAIYLGKPSKYLHLTGQCGMLRTRDEPSRMQSQHYWCN